MGRHVWRRANAALLFAAMIIHAPAARADSSSAATGGVLAGLGLQAAAGQTTLGAGSGAIEAELLASGAVDRAGALIVRLVDGVRTDQSRTADPVLVLPHDGVLDFTSVNIVKARLESLDGAVRLMPCTTPGSGAPAAGGGGRVGAAEASGTARAPFLPHGTSLTAADLVGAVTTNQSISPITLSFDDRLIIDAVAAHAGDPMGAAPGWKVDDGGPILPVRRTATTYVVPSEAVNISSTNSGVFKAYQVLMRDTAQKRVCTEAGTAAVITAVDALSTSLNSSSAATVPTPLETAMQLESVAGGRPPLVLRLSTELVGGTTITRSNIWYALGFPGAVKITAGLLVSYRLIDPAAGRLLATGFVRCAVPPTNFSDVSDAVELKKTRSGALKGAAVCSYIGRP